MSKEAKFKWYGVRPVDNGEMEEYVRADMRACGVNMRKPRDLLTSTVMLTDDWSGPSVSVWSKRGSDKFHAQYSSKTVWVTFDGRDLDGAA